MRILKRECLFLMPCLMLLLQGCISNEELYARYDSGACLLDVSSLQSTTAVAPKGAHEHPDWVPAVYFDTNDHALSAVARFQLQTTLRVLKRYPQLLLGLQGYTDNRGSAAYNLALADRRIASVKQYLVENGLNPWRVISQPLGVGLPQIGDNIELAQASNRRVGLNALDISGRPIPLLFPADDRNWATHVIHRKPLAVPPIPGRQLIRIGLPRNGIEADSSSTAVDDVR